jgi:hypothetical protein
MLQMLSLLIVLIFLCPSANAAQKETPFPDITFKAFNKFIEQNFSSKITLATVLMLLFTVIENTNLLNLHQRQQNPQILDENPEKQVELSSWLNSLTRKGQKQTTRAKFKTLFQTSENLQLIPDNEIISRLSVKLNDFIEVLGLNSFGSGVLYSPPCIPARIQRIPGILGEWNFSSGAC